MNKLFKKFLDLQPLQFQLPSFPQIQQLKLFDNGFKYSLTFKNQELVEKQTIQSDNKMTLKVIIQDGMFCDNLAELVCGPFTFVGPLHNNSLDGNWTMQYTYQKYQLNVNLTISNNTITSALTCNQSISCQFATFTDYFPTLNFTKIPIHPTQNQLHENVKFCGNVVNGVAQGNGKIIIQKPFPKANRQQEIIISGNFVNGMLVGEVKQQMGSQWNGFVAIYCLKNGEMVGKYECTYQSDDLTISAQFENGVLKKQSMRQGQIDVQLPTKNLLTVDDNLLKYVPVQAGCFFKQNKIRYSYFGEFNQQRMADGYGKICKQGKMTNDPEKYFENGVPVVRHGEFVRGQNENLEHSMYVRGKRQGYCLIKLNVRFYEDGIEVKSKYKQILKRQVPAVSSNLGLMYRSNAIKKLAKICKMQQKAAKMSMQVMKDSVLALSKTIVK